MYLPPWFGSFQIQIRCEERRGRNRTMDCKTLGRTLQTHEVDRIFRTVEELLGPFSVYSLHARLRDHTDV